MARWIAVRKVEPGNYNARIISSYKKNSSEPDEIKFLFSVEIMSGRYDGMELDFILTLESRSKDIKARGLERYEELHHAVGLLKSSCTEDIHDRPFIIRVGRDQEIIHFKKPQEPQR